VGAFLTITLNIILIPLFGYVGSACATAICYISMAIICYATGQKHYHVPYDIKTIVKYLVLMLLFYFSSVYIKISLTDTTLLVHQLIDTTLFFIYLAYTFSQFKSLLKNSDGSKNS
jgi:O-antigen/teichoic acid export membrane protein